MTGPFLKLEHYDRFFRVEHARYPIAYLLWRGRPEDDESVVAESPDFASAQIRLERIANKRTKVSAL